MPRRALSLVLESILMLVVATAFAGGLRENLSAGPWLPIAFGSGLLCAWILLRGDALLIALGIGITLGRMQLGAPLLDASIVGSATVLQAAIVIAALRVYRVDPRFTRPRELFIHVGASLLGGLVRAAAENMTAASFYGAAHSGQVLSFVLVSQTVGVMVGLPAVTTLASAGWLARLRTSDRKAWGTVALSVLASAITAYVFSMRGIGVEHMRVVAFTVIPLLMWIALRGGDGMGVLASAFVIGIAAYNTALDRGPYALLGVPQSLFLVQTFGGAIGIAAILIHTLELGRRNAQRALQQREARLQRVLQASNDGMWEWDAALDRVDINERAARMIDLPDGVTSFPTDRSLRFVHTEDRARVTAAVDDHTAGRTAGFEVELRVARPDAEWLWVLCRGRIAQRSPDGMPLIVSGTLTDIQERKSADAERGAIEARRLQSQKLESLGLLAGGVAHDFNNILTGVLGHADLAREEIRDGSIARAHIDRVIEGARGAAELTRQMLAYAGHGRVESRLIDLSQLVAEMGHLLQVSISRRNRLRYQFAPALPPVEGDPAQLRQVVMNLILNAAEALDHAGGTIVMQLSARELGVADLSSAWLADASESLRPGLYVTLEVRDEGVGMDEGTLARIFDPFFSTKFTGRGLGLAAVLGIVHAHHGAVQVDSAPGHGTTFRVHFPAQAMPVANTNEGGSPSRWVLSGAVLVVDDETPVRNLASAMLRRMGATPMAVCSGAEALQVFETHGEQIRLAIVDTTMPGMDGPATVAALRARRPGLAIVMMSGWHEPRWDPSPQTRPDAFLPKPFDLVSLADATRTALDARPPKDSTTSPEPVAPPRTNG